MLFTPADLNHNYEVHYRINYIRQFNAIYGPKNTKNIMTNSYYDHIQESSIYIKSFIGEPPQIGIVLGTGLGNLVHQMDIIQRISYENIPHFPPVTVKGHAGELIYGKLGDKYILAQNGRYHYYEGYGMKEVTFPIRVFKAMGINKLIIASAVGGIHEAYEAGDVTVVNDHINLHHENPLQGPNDERLGTRFPDMVDAYDPDMIRLCHEVAEKLSIKLHDSIYAGLPGPNIETKAEYNYLHIIGATVVGMSTVPEVIVAKHMGMKTLVLTAITNKCYPISAIKKVTHDEVIEVAQRVEQKISAIVRNILPRL